MAYIILEVALKKKNIKLQMENQGQDLRKAVVTQFRGIPGRGDYLKREGGRIWVPYVGQRDVSDFASMKRLCSSSLSVCYCLEEVWRFGNPFLPL